MHDQNQDQVKSFSEEKFKALAEKNSWTFAYAQGYVEGEARRRSGQPLTRFALIGIDQYALGSRAAFFDRRNPESPRAAAQERLSVTQQLRLQA